MHSFWVGSFGRDALRNTPSASTRRRSARRRGLKLLVCLVAWALVNGAVVVGASLGLIDLSQQAFAATHSQALAAVAAVAPHPVSPHTAASVTEPLTRVGFGLPVGLSAGSEGAPLVTSDLALPSKAIAPLNVVASRMSTLFDKDPAMETAMEPTAPPQIWTPKLPGAPGWYGPGACALDERSAPIGTQSLVWPAASHSVSGYTYSAWHPGIDVMALYGTPIDAIDTGVVVYAGWNYTGYGNFVIIDHGDGQWSAYAHLSQILVECSAAVTQGELIGLAGATGNATGSHLHFEIFQAGLGQVNPWPRLP